MDLVPAGEKHIKEYFLIHSSLDTIDMMLRSKKDYFLGQLKSDDVVLYAFVNAIRTLIVTQILGWSWFSDPRRRSKSPSKKISKSSSIRPTTPWRRCFSTLYTSPRTASALLCSSRGLRPR